MIMKAMILDSSLREAVVDLERQALVKVHFVSVWWS